MMTNDELIKVYDDAYEQRRKWCWDSDKNWPPGLGGDAVDVWATNECKRWAMLLVTGMILEAPREEHNLQLAHWMERAHKAEQKIGLQPIRDIGWADFLTRDELVRECAYLLKLIGIYFHSHFPEPGGATIIPMKIEVLLARLSHYGYRPEDKND